MPHGCRLVVAVLTLGLALSAVPVGAQDAPSLSPLQVRVLGNRADLVSGGDALVEVVLPADAVAGDLRVTDNGRDVTGAFHAGALPALLAGIPRPAAIGLNPKANAVVGLVTGMPVGGNLLLAQLSSGATAQLLITNHPIGGPVIAGPQVQPWVCQTENPPNPPVGAGQPVHLGTATDAQCDTATKYEYFYHSSDTVVCNGQAPCFAPYDPASPPASVPTTTTDQGLTMPYIVRVEEGVMDRGIYVVAVLDDPTRPWTALAPQAAWNHKLVVTFGASTAVHHVQGQPSAVTDQPATTGNQQGPINWWSPDSALSRGFLVANNSLNVHGENANDNVSSEALLMLKEHITETYGLIRYTIGNGCSGGANQQYVIASMYPGLIDGIQPNCSFPDIWTTAQEVFDCVMLNHYATSAATPQAVAASNAADGHRDPSDCAAWIATFGNADNPTTAGNCVLPANVVYNPTTNPSGTRCDIQDYQQAVWGPRPPAVWTDMEKHIGSGFASRPFDNVGVQYGLKQLQAGTLTTSQFADLNNKIGGLDIDLNAQAARSVADPGSVATAYRTSQVSDGAQLASVPIIDLRAYSESAEIHTAYHSYAVRARLDAATGKHDNQIIWTWPAEFPILGVITPPAIALKSFLLMDAWLARVEADTSTRDLAAKVAAAKPADAVDACFPNSQSTSPEITDAATCNTLFPSYADSRISAGGPLAGDVLKCALKPLNRADYSASFSDADWALMQAAFPTGVCDYGKPGIDHQRSVPWQSLEGGPGGKPLGPAPVSTMLAAPLLVSAPNTSRAPTSLPALLLLASGAAALPWLLRRRRNA